MGHPDSLPDQTLLLGLGVGKKVPSWDEEKKEFVPKTEAQITLSFDHRSIDGGGAGRLLKRVIELLEDPKTLAAPADVSTTQGLSPAFMFVNGPKTAPTLI